MLPVRKFIALFLLFGVLGLAGAEPVPDLQFHDLRGYTQSLSGLRGGVTVVSFWATWCIPCREELPRLVELQRLYAKQRVRFVLISVDDRHDESKVGPYLSARHIGLDSWVGGDRDALGSLNLGSAVPATIVFDRTGEVVGRIKGPAHYEDIGIYLDWILHDHRGPKPDPVIERY